MKHYQQDRRVQSILVEVNRDLYLEPGTDRRGPGYVGVKAVVQGYLDLLRAMREEGVAL